MELNKFLSERDEVFVWKDARTFFVVKGDDCRVVEDDLFKIGEILNGKNLKWHGFDVKNVWRELGITHGEVQADLMLSAYLLKAGAIKSLGELYQTYVGNTLPEFPEPVDIVAAFEETRDVVIGKLKEQKI